MSDSPPSQVLMGMTAVYIIVQHSNHVTGPAKTKHVGTNYTISHDRSHLSSGLLSVY